MWSIHCVFIKLALIIWSWKQIVSLDDFLRIALGHDLFPTAPKVWLRYTTEFLFFHLNNSLSFSSLTDKFMFHSKMSSLLVSKRKQCVSNTQLGEYQVPGHRTVTWVSELDKIVNIEEEYPITKLYHHSTVYRASGQIHSFSDRNFFGIKLLLHTTCTMAVFLAYNSEYESHIFCLEFLQLQTQEWLLLWKPDNIREEWDR